MKEGDYKITIARMGENWSWFPWQQKSYVGEIGAHKKKIYVRHVKGRKNGKQMRDWHSSGTLSEGRLPQRPLQAGSQQGDTANQKPKSALLSSADVLVAKITECTVAWVPHQTPGLFFVVVLADATDVSVFLCSVSESPLGERLLVEVVRQQCHKYF